MHQTRRYSAQQHSRDNAFPRSWIIRLFTQRVTSKIQEEAEENHHRHCSGRNGKIIGKVAGRDAWIEGEKQDGVEREKGLEKGGMR